MNNRIVTWAAVACLSAYASSVGAVALGEMRALSALGEPLQLQLKLTNLALVNPADVRVILAPADDYTRLGLIPPLGAEQWQIVMQNGIDVSALITGAAAQQDPNINFLVQIIWPGNISVQQVTVVLLPALPAASHTGMSELSLPLVIPINDPAATGSASVAVTTPALEQPARAAVDTKQADVERIMVAPDTARVRTGDTLSQLAKAWNLPRTSLSQRQQVLAESNPQLFVAGNINQLKRGAIIRYPLAGSVILPDTALAKAWLASRQAAAAREIAARDSASAALDQPALSAASESSKPEAKEVVTLTLISPGMAQADAQSAADETIVADQLGTLSAKKNALLAEHAAMLAELAELEKSGTSQDARLKVLDARLAQLNAGEANTGQTVPASSDIRPSWIAAAVGFLLALLIIMRRRAAAASNAARATAVITPELVSNSDYAAFEPLEELPIPSWTATQVSAVHDVTQLAQPVEDEYDFLSDAESAALQTRLDLAQAYIEMQETELARELLLTVVARGSVEQRTQATSLLESFA